MTLGSMEILTLLILLIHESMMSPFISVFSKFIPKYFIVCVAVISGVVFFISLSNNSLLVYRNTTAFHMLIFVSCIFSEFVYKNLTFLAESSGFYIYIYIIYIIIHRDNFFVSDSEACNFFPCLSALPKTVSTTLNRTDESGHPCLIPYLRGKTFNLSPLNII